MMTENKIEAIKTFDYKRPVIDKGYANQTLLVDISNSDISIHPVTEKMKEIFVGGKEYHGDAGRGAQHETGSAI